MKNEMASGCLSVLLIIGIIVILLLMIKRCTNNLEEIENKHKELIGEKIIISKDTVLLIDYNFFKNSLYTEDNRIVSLEFAQKNLLKE
jgi:hypothetical protein